MPIITDRRANQKMRSIVFYAQALAHESISNAADYLRRHGCPMDVAVRVLAREMRRAA